MALIELHQIGRSWPGGEAPVLALADIDLKVERGELLAIVGPSGCGKSTLLHLIGCLDRPSCGSYLLDGADVGAMSADQLAALRRSRFGFVFQRYQLLPQLDALANVALPALYAGVAPALCRQRARSQLELLGLGHRLQHRPAALSGGQQQRVAIARALVGGADIILADEPTGALDSRSGARLLELLQELNRAGCTVIIVTHDERVAAVARRRISMADGRIVADSGGAAAPRQPRRPHADGAPRTPGWSRRSRLAAAALVAALEALRGHRLRSALSMLGIAIGVAALATIVALQNATRDQVESQLKAFLAARIMVSSGNPAQPPGQAGHTFRSAELGELAGLPGVRSVEPEWNSRGLARQRNRVAQVDIVGASAQTPGQFSQRLVQGRNLSAADLAARAQVALLDRQASQLLFGPGQVALGSWLLLDALPLQVVGTTEPVAGPFSFISRSGRIYIPSTTFTSKLRRADSIDGFSLYIDPQTPPAAVVALTRQRLRAWHGQDDFWIFSLDDEYRSLQHSNDTMTLSLLSIGAIALLVGGIGVMNIMLVSVAERTQEIGIRKAVGARDSDIRDQFLIEALALCGGGGLAGLLLAKTLILGFNAAQEQLHANLPGLALLLALIVSCSIGLGFGTVPAQRAAALDPVLALARE